MTHPNGLLMLECQIQLCSEIHILSNYRTEQQRHYLYVAMIKGLPPVLFAIRDS